MIGNPFAIDAGDYWKIGEDSMIKEGGSSRNLDCIGAIEVASTEVK